MVNSCTEGTLQCSIYFMNETHLYSIYIDTCPARAPTTMSWYRFDFRLFEAIDVFLIFLVSYFSTSLFAEPLSPFQRNTENELRCFLIILCERECVRACWLTLFSVDFAMAIVSIHQYTEINRKTIYIYKVYIYIYIYWYGQAQLKVHPYFISTYFHRISTNTSACYFVFVFSVDFRAILCLSAFLCSLFLPLPLPLPLLSLLLLLHEYCYKISNISVIFHLFV